MASVGSVEIDLLLNTESLKRQFSELKDLAVLPTLKIDKIEFDKNEIEKGFKDICVPFRFCDGSYERAISNIRDKFENEKICLNIETEIKIDLTESIKTLEILSKETSKPTTKKILVVSDTKKAEASIKQLSTKPISIESSAINKEPAPISVKLSEESLLSIQSQLDSQEFKITVASDISSALVKTATPAITVPTVATPSVNTPVVAATTVTVPDKALQASANTEQSQAKIEKSSEKSNNLLFKLVGFIGLLLSAAEVIVSIINGVRNSILKLEPGIIRELRNAPANAIRGVSEGAGFTAGRYGIGKVASGVRDKLEASGVDIGGIKKKVSTFITKIFTDLTDYIKKYNQKALPPQETAKYFLPPATSPPLLKASETESFPSIGVSDKQPDVEYEEIKPKKQIEELKELAVELEFDDTSVDSEVKSVIQTFKESISQISLEDVTIESIKTQAVSIVENLKESLSNVTVESVKEQFKTTVDNLRDIASEVTIESVKGQVKDAVKTLKESASDLTVEGVKETVKTKASEVKSKISENAAKASDKLPESVKAQALGVVETLKENLSNITVESVKLQVKTTIDSLKENLSNLTVESVKTEFTNIIENFKEKLSNITVESVKTQIDVVLEKVKSTFNDILEKLPKTKEEAKEKLKAGGVKLRDKATATATQAKEKSQQLAGKVQVKAGEIKGIVDSLSDKGLEDYKKIFEDLSKQLGVKLGSIELPKIEAASDLAGQVVAAYNELTNTIVLPQNIIDLLNNGVGKSIAEKGETFVSDALSFLTHEITHAFQVVKDIPDNISNIDIPDIGQRLMTEIEKLAEKSTGEYLQELQKLNPGKSLEFLKTKYAQVIEEVKKREKEAYIVQLKLTDGIVASFRRFIPEDGKVQKGVDSVVAKAKTVAGNFSGNVSGILPESVRSAATGAASKSTQLLSETVSAISEKTEGIRTEIQNNVEGLLFDAKFIGDDITAIIPEPIKAGGEAIGNSIGAIKEGLDNVVQATDNARFTIQTNVDNLLFEAKLATGTLTSKLPKPIKRQKTPDSLAAVQFNPSEVKETAKSSEKQSKKSTKPEYIEPEKVSESVDELSESGIEEYKKLFIELGKKLKVDVKGFDLPEIKKIEGSNITGSKDFSNGGYYSPQDNTINLMDSFSSTIKILNDGIGETVNENGLDFVAKDFSDLQILIHELTHAIQKGLKEHKKPEKINKGNVDDKTHIQLPNVTNKKNIADIYKYAEYSAKTAVMKIYARRNPDLSHKQLEEKYTNQYDSTKESKGYIEYKRSEIEAYTSQLFLSKSIIKGFKKRADALIATKKEIEKLNSGIKAVTTDNDIDSMFNALMDDIEDAIGVVKPDIEKVISDSEVDSLFDGLMNEVEESIESIKPDIEKVISDSEVDSLFDGLMNEVEETFSDGFKNLSPDISSVVSDDDVDSLFDGLMDDIEDAKSSISLAAIGFNPSEIKQKVLENTESVLQTIEEAKQKLDDEARLQEFDARLGEKIVKPKKVSKTKEAVQEVLNPATFESDAKELIDAAKEIRLPTKKNRDNNKQALSKIKQSLARLARIPLENINKRRDRIMAAMSVEIELRAEEIKKQLPDNIEQSSVIFATGGFAGKGGAGTADLAKQIEEEFRDSLVVPVANKTFDTITKVVDGLPKWLGEIIKDKILKQNIVDGVIPDAKELAAQAKAYAEKYNVPVRAIGHSGGGFVVQQAVKQANEMGVELKGVGIGTPDIGLLNPEADPNYQAYLAKDDPLRKAAKPLLGRGKTKETSGIGISASDPTKGHSVENYLKDMKLLNEINKHFNLTTQKTASGLSVVTGFFKKIGHAIRETIQPFEAVGRRIAAADKRVTNHANNFVKSIEKIKESSPMLRPFIEAIQSLSPALLALAIFKTVAGWMTDLVKSSFEITAKFQAMDTITRFLAGNSEKYASTVKFLSGEISRLSVDIESATRGYNKLAATTRGTVLEGKTNAIFTGVAQAGAAFNLTASEVEGSILALSQIAGKGVVSMEELRGQLAERIPGAFQIAARSMNMTEQQLNALIATGSLTAVDFLPKFARQLSIETAGSIEASSQTANAAMTRFQNGFKELQVSVGKPLQPILVPGLDIAAKGLGLLSKGSGIVAEAIAILTVVSFVNLNKSLLFTIKSIFSKTIAIKSLGGALISLNNVIQRTITPTLKALGLQTIVIFGVIEAFKVLKFTFDTFFSETTADKIEKTLSERFDKAAEKAEDLRKKLAKLRGEIDNGGQEQNKNNKSNLGKVNQEYKEESEKTVDLTGLRKLQYGLKQWQALSNDIKENRNAKAYIKSASTGEFKVLSDEVNTIINSSDEIIAKSKEKSDAISKLTAQATFAKGDELKDIRSQIEVLQTELQGDLATKGDDSYGLNSIDDTAQSVSFALEKLKTDLEDTVQEGPKKIIQDQIDVLEDYQKKLGEITSQAGESQPLTVFISNISKIGTAFQESSRLTEISLSKTKASIAENLRENLTKNYTAENTAALEQSRAEVLGTIQKLKDTQTVIDSLTGTLKSSTGGVSGYFDEFKDFSLEKLQSELQKTDDKDEARKRTLEALIKLRESEGSKVELQTTLQEQLLQQERERFRVAQENLDRQLAISRATVDINDARNQSVSVRRQIMGGSSQADIGLIDAENQVNIAKQREALREQELAGIKKLQADKLISAKDYENKVRELTIQGAQNSLAILQASLQEEQALRAKEVEKIQRSLEQEKVKSEDKQGDIGFNVERKGFTVQQNNLKEQVSTGKSDEIGKQLDYQKQIAEKSGDISKQEKINAEIYQNQLSSLAVRQELQAKSLDYTQQQQRLELQRSDAQARLALLEAESQVAQLQANKATAEEIDIANQTVDIRQKQVNFISEQRENLVAVQQLEQDNLAIQNETQKKDLERSRNLQIIEEVEKRINKEVEISKANSELRNKSIERSSQLLNSQLELYKVQSDYKKSELDFQAELANKVNNVSVLETIKAIYYADQVASLKVQNLAQTESLKLTQEQQRIQAEMDILDAQSVVRKLELNKGSAQDIELAKQQLDAAQQQLGNLEAIQSNERERVGIEQQSALKNLERQQYLEMQDLAVKKITSSLEQQSKLFNAQQNVAQSNAELDKQRLDYQLELANRSGDINRVEQLKAEIYLQQREEILRQGDAQLKSLDITQKQNNIELERQKLMVQSLLLEAKANLEKGKLKGASGQELNDLQQYVTIQEQQLSGIQQLVSANQEVQSLEKQQLETQQQTKLEQIDQQRQLELIDLQVQKITKSYESQQQQLDLNNSELERQSALVNAKSGLNDSVSNLEKQRLDFRIQLAELAENEVQKQQIKQQLYEQELKSLAQRQAIERETLKIAQLKQNIDIKRQEIQAEIATLEAQANIEQAKARGAGESELAALNKVLALRIQQEKSVQADKVNLAQIQQLERQKLNVDQTAANENLQQQRILDQARTAKEQQQKNSKGGNIVDTGVNVPLNINIPPLKPLPVSKTDSDKKNEIIESMKVTATNVYINGTVSASSGQNVNIETQNSDLEKVKKVENEINKLAEESRLKAANAAMDDYINKWNSDAEKERIASGLSAEQATAGGYEQARLAREEAERIKADLASGKLKTTGAEGFTPQAIMTPLQRLQAELDAAQKAVDSSRNKPNKNTSNSQETEGGTNVNVENLVIVSADPTGDARMVLNDLAASKGKC